MPVVPPIHNGDDALAWLVRLRWFAVVGQSLTVLLVDHFFRIDLPLIALFGLIGVTAASNVAAAVRVRSSRPSTPWLAGALMATDVLVLTALLFFTGGSGNPFASFYLVHATMAAMVLPSRGAWLIWAACSIGYGLLFVLRDSIGDLHRHAICGPAMDYDLHLYGMLVSLVVTSAAIAYFVSRIMRALRERERDLNAARMREAENERFASLATLAAGVAHEIGSPLGTIAVAAGELRRAAASLGPDSTLREDAELIAEEVARCRSIMDRLGEHSGAMGDVPRSILVSELIQRVRETLPSEELPRFYFTGVETSLAVVVPPLALSQALGVLVKNAFDASRECSAVFLTVDRREGEVRFVVEDAGAGLSAEALAHAGEPFFTTKEPGRGMGLGLFLVRLLARRLNGTLVLESIPNGGTRAILTVSQPFSK